MRARAGRTTRFGKCGTGPLLTSPTAILCPIVFVPAVLPSKLLKYDGQIGVYQYRGEQKGMQVLLSRTQARSGRAVKHEQEQNSHNHVQAFLLVSVYIRVIAKVMQMQVGANQKLTIYGGDLTVNPETKYPAWSVWFCCALLTRLCYTSTTCFDLKFKRNGVGRIRKENGPGI